MSQKNYKFHKEVRPPSDTITISRSAFSRFQYLTVTVLIAIATFHHLYRYTYGEGLIWRLTSVFDPGREDSISTAFSSLNLLISSILLFAIYRHSKGRNESIRVYWLSLCIIMFGLSIDEVAGFHERFQQLQDYTGVLIPVIETRSWLLYGATFTIVVLLFFIRFLLQLDHRTAVLFLLSGAIFVTGAVGFEFLGAWMMHNEIVSTRTDLAYLIRRLMEEGLEMYGIALFNCTLFEHVVANGVSLNLMARL